MVTKTTVRAFVTRTGSAPSKNLFRARCVYCPFKQAGEYTSYSSLRDHVLAAHPEHADKYPPRT